MTAVDDILATTDEGDVAALQALAADPATADLTITVAGPDGAPVETTLGAYITDTLIPHEQRKARIKSVQALSAADDIAGLQGLAADPASAGHMVTITGPDGEPQSITLSDYITNYAIPREEHEILVEKWIEQLDLPGAKERATSAQEQYNQAKAAFEASETDDSFDERKFREYVNAHIALEDAKLDLAITAAQHKDYQRGDGLTTETDKALKEKRNVLRRREIDANDDVGGGGGGETREYTVADDGTVSYTEGEHTYTVSDDALAQGVREAAITGDASGLSSVDQVTVSTGDGGPVVAANYNVGGETSGPNAGLGDRFNADRAAIDARVTATNAIEDPAERAEALAALASDVRDLQEQWTGADTQGGTLSVDHDNDPDTPRVPMTVSEWWGDYAAGITASGGANRDAAERSAASEAAVADFNAAVAPGVLSPADYARLAEEWRNRADNHLVSVPVDDPALAEGGGVVHQTPSGYFARLSADPSIIAAEEQRERERRILPGETGGIGAQAAIDPVTGAPQVSQGVAPLLQARQDEREQQELFLSGETGGIGAQAAIDPVTGAPQVSQGVAPLLQARQDEREQQELFLSGETGGIGAQAAIDPVTGAPQVSQGVAPAIAAAQAARERQEPFTQPDPDIVDVIRGDHAGRLLTTEEVDRAIAYMFAASKGGTKIHPFQSDSELHPEADPAVAEAWFNRAMRASRDFTPVTLDDLQTFRPDLSRDEIAAGGHSADSAGHPCEGGGPAGRGNRQY